MMRDPFAPDFAGSLAAQWNRGPKLFRGALREPLFDGAGFMTALRGTAREYAANPGAPAPPGRLYINGDLAKPQQVVTLLPRGASETCEQYVARIRAAHPQDGIGLVLDNCEKHLTSTRDELVPVLHRLFAHAGYPARRNHLCIYAGNYRSTPFGIHRDDCHVLMFCGVGTKKMAFWPRPYFEDMKELHSSYGKVRAKVSDHIAQATVLEIGPLDALYWSADDWHVAVSETADFQAALSVGLYHQGSSGELMSTLEMVSALTKHDGLDIDGLPAASAGRLSAADLREGRMASFFARWDRLKETVTKPAEDEFRALRLALRLISSAGYGPSRVPLPAPPDLAGTTLVCPTPDALIVSPIRGGLMVGANGEAFFYDAAPGAIEQAVLSLRDGGPHRADDLIAAADAGARDLLRSVLRDLAGSGALSVQPGGASV